MKNRKGVSLIWVIIALVFVSMMTMSIATIAQSNILQAKRQDDTLQAYYVARSGAELAYEALITSSPSLLIPFTSSSNSGNSHILTHKDLEIGSGKVDIEVTSTGLAAERRIQIKSVGNLNGIAKTIILEFNATTHGEIRWIY